MFFHKIVVLFGVLLGIVNGLRFQDIIKANPKMVEKWSDEERLSNLATRIKNGESVRGDVDPADIDFFRTIVNSENGVDMIGDENAQMLQTILTEH